MLSFVGESILGCPLFRGCFIIKVNGDTIGTSANVYIVGVRHSGVVVKWVPHTVLTYTDVAHTTRDLLRIANFNLSRSTGWRQTTFMCTKILYARQG